uniref:Uncharacterized protein n=1 Tax=Anguilla anguilla TaxID=7936 RepID=A0A0E9RGW5_ANGAN
MCNGDYEGKGVMVNRQWVDSEAKVSDQTENVKKNSDRNAEVALKEHCESIVVNQTFD